MVGANGGLVLPDVHEDLLSPPPRIIEFVVCGLWLGFQTREEREERVCGLGFVKLKWKVKKKAGFDF